MIKILISFGYDSQVGVLQNGSGPCNVHICCTFRADPIIPHNPRKQLQEEESRMNLPPSVSSNDSLLDLVHSITIYMYQHARMHETPVIHTGWVKSQTGSL